MEPGLAQRLAAVDSATLGARIKAARQAAGLTQPQLAGEDASVAYLSRIERGERRPGIGLLSQLAPRLKVTVEELVLGFDRGAVDEVALQLDYADLELAGGAASAALRIVTAILGGRHGEVSTAARTRARVVEASALDATGDGAAVVAYENILDEEPDAATRLKAATALSRIYREQGQLSTAEQVAREALGHADVKYIGDTDETVRLSVTLAAAIYEQGRVDDALAVCRDAISAAEQLVSPRARAAAYWNASVMENESGNASRALDLARTAVQLLENADGVKDLARLRTQFSTILLSVDPPMIDDAKKQLNLADRELAWSDASPADRARNELVAARVLSHEGDTAEARVRAEAAVAGSGDLPLVRVAGLTLLGQLAWSEDDLPTTQDYYRNAILVLTSVGADRGAGQLWFELGALADEVGLVDEARDAYRRAAASVGLMSSAKPKGARIVR